MNQKTPEILAQTWRDRAAAQERFQAFIDQVGRRLAAGKRTAAEVVAKITPDGVTRAPAAKLEAAE